MNTEEAPQDAFCRLYAETWPAVLKYLRRRCGVDTAEDLANEVYLIAWLRWSDVPRPRELPWLYGVARNLLLERSRREKNGEVLAHRIAREPILYGDLAAGVVDAVEVRRALASLRQGDREILLLWAWEGLATADLGRALGCSATTAAVRLYRARRRFLAQYSVADHDPTSDALVRTGLGKAVHTDEAI